MSKFLKVVVGFSGLIVICCLGLLVFMLLDPDRAALPIVRVTPTSPRAVVPVADTSENNPAQPTIMLLPTDLPLPTNTPQPTAPPHAEIRRNYETMTDAQWNAYAKTIEGSHVDNWEGVVSDVDEGEIFGGFTILVQMPGDFLSTVYIDVPEDVAMIINKNSNIRFSGEIETASDLLGLSIHIGNVAIENLE